MRESEKKIQSGNKQSKGITKEKEQTKENTERIKEQEGTEMEQSPAENKEGM